MTDVIIEVTKGHGNHRIITTDQVKRIRAVIAAANDFINETLYSYNAVLDEREVELWEALEEAVSAVGRKQLDTDREGGASTDILFIEP